MNGIIYTILPTQNQIKVTSNKFSLETGSGSYL